MGKRRPSISKSAQAGLTFPVGRIKRHFKQGRYAARVAQGAAIFTAATLEYLIAEVVELAGNACRDNNRSRITPRHITLAVKNDEELTRLFDNCVISQGGVLPHIQPALLVFKTPSKKKATPEKAKTASEKQKEKD